MIEELFTSNSPVVKYLQEPFDVCVRSRSEVAVLRRTPGKRVVLGFSHVGVKVYDKTGHSDQFNKDGECKDERQHFFGCPTGWIYHQQT